MAKKDDTLTPRQRQSQRIVREKALRKKRQAILHKLQWIGGVAAAMMLVAGSLFLWKSGMAVRAVQQAYDGAYQLTVRAGFSVQSIYLEGRGRTSMADIDKALEVNRGDPILKLSLDDIRARLQTIESVQFAAVERELPGTLHVRIVEREPVALWQHQGKLAPVDDQGIVMNDIDAKPYQHLPLIVGDDAPKHVAELLVILSSEPQLAKEFAAAIWIGDRRWNIRMSNGLEIKLPEGDAQTAWKKLAELETKNQLFERNVKVVDLRIPGKLFITVAPQDMPGKTKNARET